jgi:site-specific DNA-cytosine methylase
MIEVKEKLLEGYTFIDLFAGLGGFHLALESAGAECVYANEWDKHAQDAYFQNFGIMPDGDIALYMRVGDQTILFGGFDNIDYKFRKLEAFYKNVVPIHGWNKYSVINLKYADQVVCTLKKEKNKK